MWIVTGKQRYLATQSLRKIQEKLEGGSFRRILRNALVNVEHVQKLAALSASVEDSALGLQRVLELKSYKTAWTWLHKLRRAMVRPGRDRLTGRVEVDETFTAGVDEGTRGRHAGRKTLIVIAAQEDGPGIGRIRMRRIPDASAESLLPFIEEAIAPGGTVHTDGWAG